MILPVLLSRMIPLPFSLPYMELQRGVPTLLERPEVKHDVWLEPGMLRGEGASDERWRIRFRFFTVWNTRFGCSLERHGDINIQLTISREHFNMRLEPNHWQHFISVSQLDTSAPLRQDHPSAVPSSWCPLFLLPESPGEEGKIKVEMDFAAERSMEMLTDMFMNMSSPSGTDPENGNASMCRVVGFYFSGSWAPPGPHEAFPCTLRTCPVTLSAGGRKIRR